MWKREEPPRPVSVPVIPETPAQSMSPARPNPTWEEPPSMHEEPASIGKSIVINGQLSGSEDLTIEGRVDGKIELRDHVLTVGPNGRIKAQVSAKAVVVLGQVTGNLTATEKVDIKENGSVEGDIVAPRVAIADGSHFRGSIDMKKDQSSSVERPHSAFKAEKPEPKASVPAATVTNDYARV